MLEVFTFEQGTPEWLEVRRGIPTSSMFDVVMGKGRDKSSRGVASYSYMRELLGEILTGEIMSFDSKDCERGRKMEPVIRDLYEMVTGEKVEPIGFMRNGRKGASTDGLIGSNGIYEVKSKLPKYQIEVLLNDVLPEEHKPQVQGGIWIAEREWCDFVSYWPGLPPFIKRVYRDDNYIRTISHEIDAFNNELDEMRARIEGMS